MPKCKERCWAGSGHSRSIIPHHMLVRRNRPRSSAATTDSLAVLGFIEAKENQQSTKRARNLTLAWFRKRFAADLPADAATADRSSTESGGRKFLSALQAEGGNAIWACWLDDVHPESPATGMIIEAVIWSSGSHVKRFGFRLLGDPSRTGDNEIAKGIQSLCDLHAAVTETTPEFDCVRSEDQARKLAAHLLTGQRRRPAIVLSTRRNAGTPRATELDAMVVAAGTSGLATVHVITSDWTRHLASRFGRNLAVFGGAVRVYLPGLQEDRDPQRHEVYLVGSKPTAEAREQAWQRLQCLVAEQSAEIYRSSGSQIPYSAVESEAIALRRGPDSPARRHRAPLERMLSQLRTGLAWTKRNATTVRRALAGIRRIPITTETESLRFEIEATKHKLRESEQSRRKLVRQISGLQRQAGDLRSENNALKEKLQSETARAEELLQSLALHELPTTWSGIIGWCEREFHGKLLLHPAILRDLPHAQYEDVRAAARGLYWLAGDYRMGRLGGRGGDLLGAIPDGQGVRNERCGSDSFTVDWQGRSYPVEWHLRKGDRRDPRHCLRIYYFWDPELKQIVVADMPVHRN